MEWIKKSIHNYIGIQNVDYIQHVQFETILLDWTPGTNDYQLDYVLLTRVPCDSTSIGGRISVDKLFCILITLFDIIYDLGYHSPGQEFEKKIFENNNKSLRKYL